MALSTLSGMYRRCVQFGLGFSFQDGKALCFDTSALTFESGRILRVLRRRAMEDADAMKVLIR